MKYQYRMETFSFLDYAGLERHLAKMAAKGWQLERIGRVFWKYRKEEPKQLTYSVTYIPGASVWDPQPSEAQQTLTDFCKEAGWEKVCDWVQMQIFVSEKPDPTPIETDETIRLEMIRKSMKKNILWGHGVLALVFLLNILLRLSAFMERPLKFLSDRGDMWVILLYAWSVFLMLWDLLYYYFWVKKSEKNIREGGKCAEAKRYRLIALIGWIGLIPLLIGTASQLEGSLSFILIYSVGIFGVVLATWTAQRKLREKGVSKGVNIMLTLLVDVVLVSTVTGLTMWYGVSYMGWSREAPRYYTTKYGYNFPLYDDALPLTIEDLMTVDYDDYNKEMEIDEALFLRYADCRQETPPNGDDVPGMRYEIYTIKFGLSYDWVIDAIEKDEMRYYTDDSLAASAYIPVNAAEWNADEVYQFQFGTEEGTVMENQWLIRKGNVIVVFNPSFELTNEMKPIITGKLTA